MFNNNAIEITANKMIIKKKNLPSNWLANRWKFQYLLWTSRASWSIILFWERITLHTPIDLPWKSGEFFLANPEKCVSIQVDSRSVELGKQRRKKNDFTNWKQNVLISIDYNRCVWWIAVKWTKFQKQTEGHVGVCSRFVCLKLANEQRTADENQ